MNSSLNRVLFWSCLLLINLSTSIVLCEISNAQTSPGALDFSFNSQLTFNGSYSSAVNATIKQSDGKIIIGGSFSFFNSFTSGHNLVRLNTDGSLDTDFANHIGIGFNNDVNAVALQSDGKIIVGGSFNEFNGIVIGEADNPNSGQIARLNSDGTLDPSFTANIQFGFNLTVYALAVQKDDSIVVGGSFLAFNNTPCHAIARLTKDGFLDIPYIVNNQDGDSFTIYGLALQSDGKIVIAGQSGNFYGTNNNSIFRLNTDGSLDQSFTNAQGSGYNNDAYCVAIQKVNNEEKIVVGGSSSSFNGTPIGYGVSRINSDGSLDQQFEAAIGSGFDGGENVLAIAIQANGKIILGTDSNIAEDAIYPNTFNHVNVTNGIIRLQPNGSLDTDFSTNQGLGFSSTVRALTISDNNEIIAGGDFLFYNQTAISHVASIDSSGAFDPNSVFNNNIGKGFNQPGTVSAIGILNDQQRIIGGNFNYNIGAKTIFNIAITNNDGTLDIDASSKFGTGFSQNNSNDGIGSINAIAIQKDGKILVAGNFNTFNGKTIGAGIARFDANLTLNTEFESNCGTGFGKAQLAGTGSVNAIQVLPNGNIVATGIFDTFNNTSVGYLACLNNNGTLNEQFTQNSGIGLSEEGYALALQSDSKIIVGGQFQSYNSTPTGIGILRLNLDGTLDNEFTAQTTPGLDSGSHVYTLAIQNDNKILVGGDFNSFNNSQARAGIIRLEPNGSLDKDFSTLSKGGFINPTATRSIALEKNGNILVGGDFTNILFSFTDQINVGSIVELNSDGTINGAFQTSSGQGFESPVDVITTQPDGKILVGGSFAYYNRMPIGSSLVRLMGNYIEPIPAPTPKPTPIVPNIATISVIKKGNHFVVSRAGGDLTQSLNANVKLRVQEVSNDGSNPDLSQQIFVKHKVVEFAPAASSVNIPVRTIASKVGQISSTKKVICRVLSPDTTKASSYVIAPSRYRAKLELAPQ